MPAGWEERYDRGQCSTAESVDCHGARLKRPESFTPSLKLKGPDGSFEALENQEHALLSLFMEGSQDCRQAGSSTPCVVFKSLRAGRSRGSGARQGAGIFLTNHLPFPMTCMKRILGRVAIQNAGAESASVPRFVTQWYVYAHEDGGVEKLRLIDGCVHPSAPHRICTIGRAFVEGKRHY